MLEKLLNMFRTEESPTTTIYYGPKCNYCKTPLIEPGIYYTVFKVNETYICINCLDNDKYKLIKKYLETRGAFRDYPEII